MEAENRSFRIRQAPNRIEARAAANSSDSLGFIATDRDGKEYTLWCTPSRFVEHEDSRQCTLSGHFGPYFGTGVVTFFPEESLGTIRTNLRS